MRYLDTVRARAFESLTSMERSARVSASLGPEYGVTLKTADLQEFIDSCRTLMARNKAAEIVERALFNRWALVCFVLGLIVGHIL